MYKIRNNRRWSMCVLLLLIMTPLLTAASCSNPATIENPAEIPAPAPAQEPAYTFGIIYPLAHSYYETITLYAMQAAEPLGIEFIVKAPDEANLEQQIRMIETMIRQGVDGIAIAPIDSHALVPIINRAVEAGIPVITFESDAPDSKRLAFIGADNEAAGVLMGEAISDLLNGQGMILVESGMSQMESMKQRLDGFLTYINEQTEIDVLEVTYNEGNAEHALSELEIMIDDHPHFDAFVALDFLSGETSILVWKSMGLSRYALTFGMMPEIEEAIRNGQITKAVSQQEHTWGAQIIESLVLAKAGDGPPSFIDTGTMLVDADTD